MSDVNITLGLDDSEYKKGLDGVEKKTRDTARNSGNELERNVGDRGARAFRRLAIAATAAAGAIAAGLFTRASIRAASEQESVTRRLEFALVASGQEVDNNRLKIEEFANELQKTTTLSNEAVEAQAAYALSLGVSAQNTIPLVRASADLSSALGVSLQGATQRLARTLEGDLSARLAQLVPELRNLTEEQLRAGDAVDIVARRFAGAAASEAQTFQGRLTQLSETFADLQKSIGQFATGSEAITGFISALRVAVQQLDIAVQGTDNSFGRLIERTLGNIFQATISVTTRSLITLNNILFNTRNFLNFIADVTLASVESFERLNLAAARAGGAISRFFGRDQEARESQIAGIEERIRLVQIARQVGEEETRENLEQQERINESLRETGELIRQAFLGGDDDEERTPFTAFTESLTETADAVDVQASRIENRFDGLEKTFDRIIKGGIVRSTQLLGATLVEGGNFFKGFTAIALDAIGDLLIAFGSGAIATGAVAEALRAAIGSLSGGPAIVAGLAAIAAGGALKAFSSKIGGASGGSPSIGSSLPQPVDTGPQPTDTRDVEETSRREPSQNVQLVVQGDILDSEDTGRRLVEVLNDNFRSDNSALVGARFA